MPDSKNQGGPFRLFLAQARHDKLLASEDFSDLFKSALQKCFSELKHIIIGVAIPVTVNEKLITADYFYLLFATDSIMVADGFLKAYETQVNIYRKKNIQGTFFEEHMDDEILKFLKDNQSKDISLNDMISHLFNKFLSWKAARKEYGFSVPTIKNIICCLNKLKNRNSIVLSCGEDFIYKKNGKYGDKGDLAYSKFKSGRDIGLVRIGLKR